MQPFTIKILGGRFTIREIVPKEKRSEGELIGNLLSIPAERWFVLQEQSGHEGPQDMLALIDDQLEFRTVAVGTFDGDN